MRWRFRCARPKCRPAPEHCLGFFENVGQRRALNVAWCAPPPKRRPAPRPERARGELPRNVGQPPRAGTAAQCAAPKRRPVPSSERTLGALPRNVGQRRARNGRSARCPETSASAELGTVARRATPKRRPVPSSERARGAQPRNVGQPPRAGTAARRATPKRRPALARWDGRSVRCPEMSASPCALERPLGALPRNVGQPPRAGTAAQCAAPKPRQHRTRSGPPGALPQNVGQPRARNATVAGCATPKRRPAPNADRSARCATPETSAVPSSERNGRSLRCPGRRQARRFCSVHADRATARSRQL